MHLPDIIEVAKVLKIKLKAKSAEIHVHSNGELAVAFWAGSYGSNYTIIAPHKVRGWQDRAARTLEDAEQMVDDWIDSQNNKKATAADFGMSEDGTLIVNAAE